MKTKPTTKNAKRVTVLTLADADVAALCVGEWARCEAAAARSKTMVAVPGLPGGWRVTPSRRAQITADLKARKSATFTPAGFGTGYLVTTRPRRGFDVNRLPTATSDFFGVVGPLFYETLDCD